MPRQPKALTKAPKAVGRPKGSQTSYGKRGRELALKLVTNPVYLEKLNTRLLDGTLPAAFESLLWHYAYGRPAETDLSQTKAPVQGAVINVITSSPTTPELPPARTTTIVTSALTERED